MDDSGRYTMIVQNKYGGESVDIVVSVIGNYRIFFELWHPRPKLILYLVRPRVNCFTINPSLKTRDKPCVYMLCIVFRACAVLYIRVRKIYFQHNIMSHSVSLPLQVSVYRQGEKIPEAKPTLTPKTIIPPKLPIEIPQSKTQPAPSPAPPKSAGGRGVKSPTPTRRK